MIFDVKYAFKGYKGHKSQNGTKKFEPLALIVTQL